MANFGGILNTSIGIGGGGGTDKNGEPGSLEVVLCGFGAQFPRAFDATLGRVMQQVKVAADGTYAFTLYGNDVIKPPGTFYTIAVKDSNGDTAQVNAYIVEENGTYDLKSMVPFDPSLPMPPVPPLIINQLQVLTNQNPSVFDGLANTAFKAIINQDTTVDVDGAEPGNLYTFIIVQDTVGGHEITWGGNFYNATTTNPEPNGLTIQTFVLDDQYNFYSISAATWFTPPMEALT